MFKLMGWKKYSFTLKKFPVEVNRIVYYFIFISALFKKGNGDIAIASVRLSVTLSPPKQLDEIQPNFVCELARGSHEWGGQRHNFFGPAPWGPG